MYMHSLSWPKLFCGTLGYLGLCMCDHVCAFVNMYVYVCICMCNVYIGVLIKYLVSRLYDEAMKKGYVETSVIKCLVLGASGVGKTHLKRLLLKKDPPKQRVSTGLADNPVRAITFSRVGVGGGGTHNSDDWIVIEDHQTLLSMMGGTIKEGVPMVPSIADLISGLPAITVNNAHSDGATVGHPDLIRTCTDVNTTKNTSIQQIRTAAIEDELIHHIQQSGK